MLERAPAAGYDGNGVTHQLVGCLSDQDFIRRRGFPVICWRSFQFDRLFASRLCLGEGFLYPIGKCVGGCRRHRRPGKQKMKSVTQDWRRVDRLDERSGSVPSNVQAANWRPSVLNIA